MLKNMSKIILNSKESYDNRSENIISMNNQDFYLNNTRLINLTKFNEYFINNHNNINIFKNLFKQRGILMEKILLGCVLSSSIIFIILFNILFVLTISQIKLVLKMRRLKINDLNLFVMKKERLESDTTAPFSTADLLEWSDETIKEN